MEEWQPGSVVRTGNQLHEDGADVRRRVSEPRHTGSVVFGHLVHRELLARPTGYHAGKWGETMIRSDSHDLLRLQRLVAEFCEARDWGKFHDPKNLSMAVAVEAGELMDHFRWIHSDHATKLLDDPTSRSEIVDEVADIQILLLEFAHVTGIDLALAVESKLLKNATRYPVHLARGNATKHDRLLGDDPVPGRTD